MDNEDIFDSFMRNPTGETYAILDQDDINMINIIIFRIINYGGVFNIEHRNKYYVVDENLANQMADARYFTSIRAILPFNGTLISQKTLREIDEKEYRLVSSLQVKLDRAYLGTKFTGKLPNLTHLIFENFFHNHDEISDKISNLLDFPHLVHLTFGEYFNRPIKDLGIPNLTQSSSKKKLYQPINDLNVSKITSLTFGENFNQSINDINLPNLRYIGFGKKFNHPINLFLPRLIRLELGVNFHQPIDKLNFPNLRYLIFDGEKMSVEHFMMRFIDVSDDDLIHAELIDGKLMDGGEEIKEDQYHLVTTLDAYMRPTTVTGYGYYHYGDDTDEDDEDDDDDTDDEDYYYKRYGYDANRRHHHIHNNDEMEEDEKLISKLPNLTSLTRVDEFELDSCKLDGCDYEELRVSRKDSSEYLQYPKLTYLNLKNSYVKDLRDAYLPKLKTFILDDLSFTDREYVEGIYAENFPDLEFLKIHHFDVFTVGGRFSKLTHLSLGKMTGGTISKENFPSLMHLDINHIDVWKYGEISLGPLPNLTHLSIRKVNYDVEELKRKNLTINKII